MYKDQTYGDTVRLSINNDLKLKYTISTKLCVYVYLQNVVLICMLIYRIITELPSVMNNTNVISSGMPLKWP